MITFNIQSLKMSQVIKRFVATFPVNLLIFSDLLINIYFSFFRAWLKDITAHRRKWFSFIVSACMTQISSILCLGNWKKTFLKRYFLLLLLKFVLKSLKLISDFFFCIGVPVLLLQSEEHCYPAPPFPLSSFPYCCGDQYWFSFWYELHPAV